MCWTSVAHGTCDGAITDTAAAAAVSNLLSVCQSHLLGAAQARSPDSFFRTLQQANSRIEIVSCCIAIEFYTFLAVLYTDSNCDCLSVQLSLPQSLTDTDFTD